MFFSPYSCRARRASGDTTSAAPVLARCVRSIGPSIYYICDRPCLLLYNTMDSTVDKLQSCWDPGHSSWPGTTSIACIVFDVTFAVSGFLTLIRCRSIVSVGIYYCYFTGDEAWSSRMTWQRQVLGVSSALTAILLTWLLYFDSVYLFTFGVFTYQSW